MKCSLLAYVSQLHAGYIVPCCEQPLFERSTAIVTVVGQRGWVLGYLDTFFFYVALQPNAGYGLIHEVFQDHAHDVPQSVGLWTSDQSVAETST
jgi:hypothetical protein